MKTKYYKIETFKNTWVFADYFYQVFPAFENIRGSILTFEYKFINIKNQHFLKCPGFFKNKC